MKNLATRAERGDILGPSHQAHARPEQEAHEEGVFLDIEGMVAAYGRELIKRDVPVSFPADAYSRTATAEEKLEWFRKLAKRRGARCVSTKFPAYQHKLEFECDCGCAWARRPHQILDLGSWCPQCAGRKLDLSWFQRQAAKAGSVCLSDSYEGGYQKLQFGGPCGHEWEADSRDIRTRGASCPFCAPEQVRPKPLRRAFPPIVFKEDFDEARFNGVGWSKFDRMKPLPKAETEGATQDADQEVKPRVERVERVEIAEDCAHFNCLCGHEWIGKKDLGARFDRWCPKCFRSV